MTIEVGQQPMPACWASYLVNGDASGLNAEELAAADTKLADLAGAGWRVVDVARNEDGEGEDPWFTWSFGLYGGTAQGGDCLDYVMHREVRG